MPDDDFDAQQHALSQMTEQEKDETIIRLYQESSERLDIACDLHNTLVILAQRLSDGDALGKRGRTIRDNALKMAIIASITRKNLGLDDEQIATDSAFDEIVGRLDMEDPDE